MDWLYSAIFQEVKKQPGIKAVELIVNVMRKCEPQTFTHDEFQLEIRNLIKNEDIREEEYIDPAIPYRIKSRFFLFNPYEDFGKPDVIQH